MKNKKKLGQHWLKNREILETIADLAQGEEKPGVQGVKNEAAIGTCLEIGPGLGTLTSSLLKRFEKVVAVEFDEELARKLPGSFPGKNLEVLNEDILEFDFAKMTEPYVVAGNIPYYITSPILKKILTAQRLPIRVVLLIQKEVAERILSEKETMLSLFVKNRAEVLPGPMVYREEFVPPPKVDSEVIILIPKEPEVGEEVFKLIQRGFSAPRKKLIHNLTGVKAKAELEEDFKKIGVDVDARPGDLGIKDWEKLSKVI